MPQFSYKARRRTGEVVEGMLDVADRSAALIQIERLGLFPVAVDATKGACSGVAEPSATMAAVQAATDGASPRRESRRASWRRSIHRAARPSATWQLS